MSEPSSLFARISIRKENLETFLAAAPKKPYLDNSWINWWNSRQMIGPRPLMPEDIYAYNASSNKAILEDWQKKKNTGAFCDYDEATQTLNLGIIFFSENFGEMIPMLAFLFDLTDYKNDNPGDFAIVYPYFWGDRDLPVWITFDGKTLLLDNQLQHIGEVDLRKLRYAEDYLAKKTEQLFPQK